MNVQRRLTCAKRTHNARIYQGPMSVNVIRGTYMLVQEAAWVSKSMAMHTFRHYKPLFSQRDKMSRNLHTGIDSFVFHYLLSTSTNFFSFCSHLVFYCHGSK